VLAASGVFLSVLLEMPVFDGLASALIGLLLTAVATFLMRQCRELLVGEGVDRRTAERIRTLARQAPLVESVARPLTMYLGPDEVLLTLDVETASHVLLVARLHPNEWHIMARKPGADASRFLPENRSVASLGRAAQKCEACDLYRNATQAVFGSGPVSATIVFIGEQPGNDEDLKGLPFVGPAGKLLDRALAEAGIDRTEVYVSNVVKHFKFEERGKRRIHKKPNASEVGACHPWLEAEILLIKPKIIVCLGATAAQAVLGRDYRLTRERTTFRAHQWAPYVTATVHPSAILRVSDRDERHRQYQEFVTDLKRVKNKVNQEA
jgi:uracil-DNA glycosylase family protein